MTPPLAPEDRRRPARACLNCRGAKAKCEGTDGTDGLACTRCARLDTPCVWVALRKFGRPRRLALDAGKSGLTVHVPHALSPLPTELSSPHLAFPALETAYALAIHPFLPLLPASTPVTSFLLSAPPHLILAISALAYPHITAPQLQTTTLPSTRAGVQTALLFVHVYYGRGETLRASDALARAVGIILEKGWNRLDAPADAAIPPAEREMLRSVWWETHSADIMLATLAGRRPLLEHVAFEVLLPSGAGRDEMAALALKVRALSLLQLCTAPPDGTSPDPDHLEALSRIGQNVTFLARESFATCSVSASHTAGMEFSFMAGMISSAAIIYLHSA